MLFYSTPVLSCSERWESGLASERWATAADIDGAMGIIEAARGATTFQSSAFMPYLRRAIIEISHVLYESAAAGLFQGITRRSPTAVVSKAAAELEAIRLGWPGADWAYPGLVNGNWVIMPVRFGLPWVLQRQHGRLLGSQGGASV